MKNNVKLGISLMLVAILFTSMVFVLTASAENMTKKSDKVISTPWFEEVDELNSLTTDELHILATQNETVRKLIEEDQKLESIEIESIEDLKSMPNDFPEGLKQFAMKNLTSSYIAQMSSSTTTRSTNTVYVWIVADEEYRSYFGSNWQSEAYSTIESADNAFYSNHDINFVVGKYSEWDSNDDVHDSRLLYEAQSETGWNTNQQGMDMMAIFTNRQTDHRGWGEKPGDAWIMKHQITSGWDWHLAQHEASHNYDCPDHGYLGPYCIMTYTYMMTTDNWCNDCDQTIEDNRNQF